MSTHMSYVFSAPAYFVEHCYAKCVNCGKIEGVGEAQAVLLSKKGQSP